MERSEVTATVTVDNIGGIEQTSVVLPSDVTVLVGRNATNRTSFLQALMAALGSDEPTLKADAEEGSVELEFDGRTYTRTLRRRGDGVAFGGDPYLEDAEVADLFAFLLESNEARQAVARADDLRNVIMQPVDTAEIQAHIDELRAEKQEVTAELDRLSSLSQRLPDLEQRRQRLKREIAEKRDELDATEAEIASHGADLADEESPEDGRESKLDALKEARSELEEVRFNLETERESIDALEEELADVEAELAELPESADAEIDAVDAELDELRDEKSSLDAAISQLRTIIQFNEEMLDDSRSGALRVVEEPDAAGRSADAITSQLVDSETVVCWTCGSDVARADIDETVERLRETLGEKREERRTVADRIETLETERIEYEERRRQRDQLENRRSTIEDELARRRSRVESLEDRRDDLQARVDEIEAEVDDADDARSELIDLHKEANRLEFELGQLQSDLGDVEDEIADVEAELAEQDRLAERRDEIQAELTDLRTRIERIEQDAVDRFNDHMERVLDVLEYENVARVWIERVEPPGQSGRESAADASFELHVVREAASGVTYEDTVEHLSESERKVMGLVFALAGYLVHDLHETVPFMLLDSLEAIDSERIAALVDYFADHVPYLVVALLPEDAAALDDGYGYVHEI